MTEKKNPPLYGLTGNALKFIAILTMLIDHAGAALIEKGIYYSGNKIGFMEILNEVDAGQWHITDMVLRTVGRIAFPIFCFLLVEGFLHTRDEVKYAGKLLLFAFISEIPFDLAFFKAPFYIGAQNVYFTLFIGVAMMCFLKKYEFEPGMRAVTVGTSGVIAYLLRSDYSYWGILLIASFYLFRNMRSRQFLTAGILTAAESLALSGAAALALLPIACYNGQRGKLRLKYVFYWIYPAHIAFLCLLRYLLFGSL